MTGNGRVGRAEVPKAVVHKQILDAAAENPDCSVQELATQVSSATEELVERVLDEYGDPAGEQEQASGTDSGPPEVALSELTDRQRETLRLVYEHPTASQRELANEMGVSHTAVYNHLQSIDGFDWENRWEFVTELFGCPTRDCPAVEESADADGGPTSQAGWNSSSVFDDAELVQKLMRLCVETDVITDEEFQRIADEFLQRTTGVAGD